MTTTRELIAIAEKKLTEVNIETAQLDAEVLLAFALGITRAELYTKIKPATEDQIKTFTSYIDRRANDCPVAYITGVKEFWSIPLKVTQDVLIPRPESEHVVERALEIIRNEPRATNDEPRILDLCTGSGNIAAALATELPNARFALTDISAAAVEIARINLKFASNRTEFFVGDLFSALTTESQFDLITANPPYVPTGHQKMLGREITEFEPSISLYGGKSGLDFIAKIIEEAPAFLKTGGWIVMEMGLGQADKLTIIANECGGYDKVVISKDLVGIERVISLRCAGNV